MRAKRGLLFAVAVLAFGMAGSSASSALAAIITLEAELDPFQEVPPHNTPAYGSVEATLDTTSGAFSIVAGTGQYADLLGGSSSVRLSDGAAGANGPTISLLVLDDPGATTGTFSGSASPNLTMAQITDAMAGNTYINIADSVYPSGELRGQLTVTPEPSSLVLAAMAAVGLLVAARKRL
ncbi:MAG TPA: CHRD domain-containing protein [Pirellulales bacterium]|nr:CHRD domain-containing protein [Pirellulales bacterium]